MVECFKKKKTTAANDVSRRNPSHHQNMTKGVPPPCTSRSHAVRDRTRVVGADLTLVSDDIVRGDAFLRRIQSSHFHCVNQDQSMITS